MQTPRRAEKPKTQLRPGTGPLERKGAWFPLRGLRKYSCLGTLSSRGAWDSYGGHRRPHRCRIYTESSAKTLLLPDQAMASENSSLSEGVTCLGATTRAYGHREA